jgi:tetratricopeptide (TPR) repeat protein
MWKVTRAVVCAGLGAVIVSAVPAFCQSVSVKQQIEVHTRQAAEYLAAGKPDLAAREFNAVLALDPKNVDARGNLGVVLYFQGQLAKALPYLRDTVKAKPGLWNIQALLGMCQRRTGELTQARENLAEAFSRLQEEKLRFQVGMELMELCYQGGDLGKAAEAVSQLRQLWPANPDVQYAAYRIYSDLAGESMLSLAMSAPKSAQMHMAIARELTRLGEGEAVVAHYREVLKLDPSFPGIHFELAEAMNSVGAYDPAEVAKEYQAALAQNPFDAKSESRLGEIALAQSDLATALKRFSRAAELSPDAADDASTGEGAALSGARGETGAVRRDHSLSSRLGLPGAGAHSGLAPGARGIPAAQEDERSAEADVSRDANEAREGRPGGPRCATIIHESVQPVHPE